MQFYIINESDLKCRPSTVGYFIENADGFALDDIILIKRQNTSELLFASKVNKNVLMPEYKHIGGVTLSEIRIIDDLFESYYEYGNINEIIEMYPDITMGSLIEMFKKSIGIVLNTSVGNTNTNEREVKILTNLICGKYTKREVLSKGTVTVSDIDSIYKRFVEKLEKSRPVLSISPPLYERLSQFYDGNTVFTNSVSQYANQNGLDEAWLVKLIKNVAEKVYEQNGISIKEKDFLVNAIENDKFASYSFAAESFRLRWVINRITKHYYQIEKDFLKKLNNKFWIHIPSLNTTAATEDEQYRDRVLFFREFKKYVEDKGFHIDRVFPNTKE